MRARLAINVAAVTLAIALVGAPQALAAAPAVTGLTPPNGPAAGGNSVTITGTDLTTPTAVSFGGSAATSFTSDLSGTQITAIAPAGTAGTMVDVTVTNLEGPSENTAEDDYTYEVPAPTVTSLNPTHGTAAGGNSVTITGTDLSGATAVHFDANSASIIIATASTVVVDAPAGTAGNTAQVTVTTPGGTSPTGGSGNGYTYDPPAPPPAPDVTGLSPNHGAAAGGTTVTVFGTNFSGATAVKFGSTNATGFSVNNGSKITATAPTGTAGKVDVTVTTPSDTSSTTGTDDDYTYDIPAPTVSSLNPTHGPAAGGTSVTITGTNLTGATAVKFDANPASFTVDNPTRITATAPAGVGGTTAQVTVTTPGGTSPAKLYDYEVPPTPAPVVTGLNPSHGSAAGGTSVTITGSNFTGATAVRFGTTYAPSFTLDSATQITATAPPGTAGSMVDVAVITGAGASSKTGTGNDYTYDHAPVVPVVAERPVPATFLTHRPKHRTRRRQVAFAFSSDMPGVSYQCLFAQGWAKCSSPHTFRHLKPGRYKFQVKAIVNGVEDPTPASWTFRVRRLRHP